MHQNLSDDAASAPQVDASCVIATAKEKFRRSIACCADVCDFGVGGLGCRVVGVPGDAEIGDVEIVVVVGWAASCCS